jgi:uncharacterized protein DUF937
MQQDLMNLVLQQLDGDQTRQIAEQVGIDPAQVRQVAAGALPHVMSGMSALQGAGGGAGGELDLGGILDGLGSPGGLGSILGGLMGGGSGASAGGLGDVLGQMFGERHGDVTSDVSRQTGLRHGQAQQLVMMLLPLLISAWQQYRARQARAGDAPPPQAGPATHGGGGLGDVLGGMLDKDHDGSVVDDVLGGLLGDRKP